MTTDYSETPAPQPRPLRTALLIALVAFVLALVLAIWAFTRWEPARRLIAPPVVTPAAPLNTAPPIIAPMGTTPLATALPATGMGIEDVAVTQSRVAGLEARLAQIDARADVASANAARAEGLLIAFAARRAIDRGVALGYLEGQLRARFADTQPRAVAAVIAGAQSPVTLDGLRRRLDLIAPDLAGLAPNEGWDAALKRTVGSLFIVRRADTPSPAADQRLTRARLALDAGQVDVALAEVARLPGRAAATEWMAGARRYIEAHRALDILEAAALTAGTPAQTGVLP